MSPPDAHVSSCKVPFLVAGILVSINALGQRSENVEEKGFEPHRITALLGYSFIPAADNIDGQANFFIVPALGLNYDYWFSEKFAVGLHNDFILQQFAIERASDEAIITRSFPIVMNGVVLFKPSEKWTTLFGVGREFEKSESLTIINLGLEYGIELPDDWELSVNLLYDNKIDAYHSWMFGAGFSKRFGRN